MWLQSRVPCKSDKGPAVMAGALSVQDMPAQPDPCVTSHELYNDVFDEFAGFPNTRDVGPAFLNQPVFPDQYASLAAAESLDRLSTKRGQQDVIFTISG